MRYILIAIAVYYSFFGLLFGVCVALHSYQCDRRWQDSGMASRYQLFVGCQVKINRHWVPEKSYRQLDNP